MSISDIAIRWHYSIDKIATTARCSISFSRGHRFEVIDVQGQATWIKATYGKKSSGLPTHSPSANPVNESTTLGDAVAEDAVAKESAMTCALVKGSTETVESTAHFQEKRVLASWTPRADLCDQYMSVSEGELIQVHMNALEEGWAWAQKLISGEVACAGSVSYTHLTLPTILLV